MATTVCKGIYKVISDTGTYRTDFINHTCTCKSWYYTKYCKHLKFLGVKK